MKFKPEPKPKLVQPAAQVLHVVWLVQPVVIHGSLAGPACRPSAHLVGGRTIKGVLPKFGWFSLSLKCQMAK